MYTPESIDLIPQGLPTVAFGSDEIEDGFNHRRVRAAGMSSEDKIARPNRAKSEDDEYMFPVLYQVNSVQ